jgi:transcriptional regulator with XRE-family HTH domain
MPRLNKTKAKPTNPSALGANLRRLREASKRTQKQLADELGVHVTHISRVETNEYSPALDLVLVLMEKFKVDANALLNAPHTLTPQEQEEENAIQEFRSLYRADQRKAATLIFALKNKIDLTFQINGKKLTAPKIVTGDHVSDDQ